MPTNGFTLTISDGDCSVKDREKNEQLKINISRLARLSSYSLSHISRVIRGETTPSTACLKTLAKILDVEMGELYTAIGKGNIRCLK